ncbi:MAG TPA: TIGR01777 family oxidoreductase [Bryobacteraceae bacterium]
MNITISGASGLIGRRLLKVLSSAGHSLHVLSRHAGTNLPTGVGLLSVWDPMKGQPPRESLNRADVIIHLAGEPVAQRWTGEAKQRIRDTRVAGTRHLVEALSALERRPAALVCASAVGYYGSTGDEILDESAPPGSGFLPEVCTAWEAEARAAEALGMRVVSIRIGIALDTRGGALPQMSNPFRFGVGGRLGSGRQWMSWIHLSDLADLFRFAVENPVRGPINGVAPNPVQNVEFTRELGRALKRPALFVVPKLALKLVFGEMSELLVEGQRVIPRAAESAGFRFRYPELGPALADLLR